MEDDMSYFMKESCRSYRECKVKHFANKTSLQKKERGIETERKIVSAQLTREEKQLRDQLKQMNIEKMKHYLINNMRDSAKKETIEETNCGEIVQPTDPYPITFRSSRSPSPFRKEYGNGSQSNSQLPLTTRRHTLDIDSKHVKRRQRKVSSEFEDLLINLETGTFNKVMITPRRLQPAQLSGDIAPDVLLYANRRHFGSPELLRKNQYSTRGSHSSLSPQSGSNISSLEELHWAGEPKAIHSIRRPRKTFEELELEHDLHK